MQHDEQVVLERENDAFAESTKLAHALSLHGRDRWVHAAKEKRAPQPDVFERRTSDSAVQCFDVDSDVGKLRHWTRLTWSAARRTVAMEQADAHGRVAQGRR